MKKLDLDTFGEIIDGFLRDNHIQMIIDMPKGTLIPVLHENTGMGVVAHFYILLNALQVTFTELMDTGLIDPEKKEDMLDNMLDMVKQTILKGERSD